MKNYPGKKIFSGILLIFLILQLSFTALSQELRFLVDRNTIYATEPLILTVAFPQTLRKEFLHFDYYTFPELENFVKLKTEYQEDKEEEVFLVRQYYRPLKAGHTTIPAFRLQSGTLTISFPRNIIQVKQRAGEFSMPPPDETEVDYDDKASEAYLRIFSDKTEIFSGEAFTVQAELLFGQGTIMKFTDFSKQVKKLSSSLYPSGCTIDPYIRGSIENPVFDTIQLNGKTYKRLRLFEGRYYPILPGTVSIAAGQFSLITYKIARIPKGRWWKAEEMALKTQAQTIKVKELPPHPMKEKVPAGIFHLRESISNNKVTTGTTFNYVATIQGNGNMNAVLPPSFPGTDTFEIYSPEVSQRLVKDAGNLEGKIFTFEIIPKEPGSYALGKMFRWVYFNTEKKAYDTLRSRYILQVSGESMKNKEISSTVLGSFSELADHESNKLRSKEKEESIKFFANIIILFMLVTTAILVFKR